MQYKIYQSPVFQRNSPYNSPNYRKIPDDTHLFLFTCRILINLIHMKSGLICLDQNNIYYLVSIQMPIFWSAHETNFTTTANQNKLLWDIIKKISIWFRNYQNKWYFRITSIQIGLITIFNMKMRFVFIYSYKMSHNMQSIRNKSIFNYKKKSYL